MKTSALLFLALAGSALAEPGDSVVTFSEIHYHPPGLTQDMEFVELHNQLSVNVDMSGWKLDGGVTFDFPEGTVIPKRGKLVVAKNPAALMTATGATGVLGPWTGNLSDGGETLRLYNNANALRTRPETTGGGTPVETTVAEWRLGEDDPGAVAGGAGNATTAGINGGWALTKNGTATYSATVPASGSTLAMQLGGAGVYSATSTVTATDNVGMECWVRPTANGASGFSFLLSNGRTGNGGYGIVEIGGRWHIIHNGVTSSGEGPTVALNTWSHLRFIRQDGLSRLFINGVDAGISIGAAPSAPNVFHIGANTITAGFEGRFNGIIDNVRIFTLLSPPPPPVQVPGSFNTSLDRRRVMSELNYRDGGAWPLPPDGSGATLAKIDPQWGNDAPNWAWSLQPNGTPGAANFAAPPAAWNASLPKVAFNEVSGASAAAGAFHVELVNYGTSSVDLTGWQIANADTGASVPLSGSLAAGAYLDLDETALTFRPADNARLILYTPAQAQVTDAVRIANKSRARETAGTGRWLEPSTNSFGTANVIALNTDVVINEIFYHAFDDGPEQWIELKNKGASPVNIAGWSLSEAVSYTFPAGTVLNPGALLVVARDSAALMAKYPGRTIAGPWSGSLSDEGERIALEDPAGNPVDEVEYGTRIRWPEFADQGGASLELRDMRADNAQPESWTASSTAALGTWETITYTDVATDNGLGNDAFRDFLLAMLDAGEILLDDVSVREDPAGANIEFLQNGTFQADTPGAVPATWRCIGNHGQNRSVVVIDPDNASNKCLKVVATGQTDDKHNRIETTFVTGRSVVAGRTYRISFRAKWLGGSNQVNTRLYFDYLQKTTLLGAGSRWGTPGQENITVIANAGPTASSVAHSPVIPAAGAAVTVSAVLSDPDNVAAAQLFYRVNSTAWANVPMNTAGGRWSGTVPGQAAGATVQFYIRATDGAGAVADFPAAGAGGGCFYKVNDNAADNTGLRTNFRVLIAPENSAALFTSTTRMSNAMFPATIIEDERTVYYNAMMRLHGSASGRYASNTGFHIAFNNNQPYRGLHDAINTGPADAYREVLAKAMINRAGMGYWSFYDDFGKIVGPGITGIGMIQPARTSQQFVEGLFPGSGTGTLFNHELLYQPNSADANGFKIGNPYNHTRAIYDLSDKGADKETYRWGWQIRSKRRADDYTKMVALNRAFGLTGAAFESEIERLIDVDQFMRTWAIMSLYCNDDQYGRLYEHNWRLYERPTDGRFIAFPWDLDRAWLLASNAPLTPTTNTNGQPQAIQRLFTVPRWKRLFDSHILDIVATAGNSSYLNAWATHYGAAVGVDLSGNAGIAQARGTYALTQMPAAVPFEITSNGGADFSTPDSSITLTGRAWVDVYFLYRNGIAEPLPVTWTGADSWSVSLPIAPGANVITLTGKDQRFVDHGTDTITITGTGGVVPASAANLVVSELHYHPADPVAAEVTAGFASADDFEFIELQNIHSAWTVDLTGVRFDAGITYSFAPGTQIAAGARLVLPRRTAAFALRHSGVPTAAQHFISTDPTGNQFSNGGERITVLAADGQPIKSFSYDDTGLWPAAADGAGPSLVLIAPQTNPDHDDPLNWRASFAANGNPGATDGILFTGTANADTNNNGLTDLTDFAVGNGAPPTAVSDGTGGFIVTLERDTAAQTTLTLETSTDLAPAAWQPATATVLSRAPVSGTVERLTLSITAPPGATRLFVRGKAMN